MELREIIITLMKGGPPVVQILGGEVETARVEPQTTVTPKGAEPTFTTIGWLREPRETVKLEEAFEKHTIANNRTLLERHVREVLASVDQGFRQFTGKEGA